MSRQGQLAAIFQRVSDNDWSLLVEQSLRGRSIDSLATRTDDGLIIGPIHAKPECIVPIANMITDQPWVVVQRLEDPDSDRALATIEADLKGGAGGVELVFLGSASAERTGFGLRHAEDGLIGALSRAESLHLRLDAGDSTWLIYNKFRNLRFVELALACDSLAHGAARGGFDQPLRTIEAQIVTSTNDLEARGQEGTAVEADGRVWAAGGASEAQELAGILGSFAHHVRLLIGAGLPTESALGRVGITVEASSNQLITVAKVRALRLLHARLVEAFGGAPKKARIHGETSWRMMTQRDVHTNILRTTSAAFAAAVGGADSIAVLPFTIAHGLPDDFARRIARNLQIILIEEVGLARVGDPGAGAGAVEDVTAKLAEAAWEKFRGIEAEGGLVAALRSGTFQRDIAKMRDRRAERIARREIAITGISEFAAHDETKVSVLAPRPKASEQAPPTAERFDPLPAARLAEPFEALRDSADRLAAADKTPKVFLANLCAVADHANATQAAMNFFAVGGIRAVDGGGLSTPEAAAAAFAKSGAHIACIVGAPATLRTLGAATASALKAQGAARVYLMGGDAAGVDIDAVLGQGVNAVAVLGEVLALIDSARDPI